MQLLGPAATELSALFAARLGQGAFRTAVVKHWKVCAVTGATYVRLLRASHIKPWRDANDEERVDPANGLLLAPNVDAAFDAGLVSFDDNGKNLLSSDALGPVAYELHITAKMRHNAKLLTDAHRKYLRIHRDTVFLG